MSDLITAMVYTIQQFVSMFFDLQIDSGLSIGHFIIAVSILSLVIRVLFSAIGVKGTASVVQGSKED